MMRFAGKNSFFQLRARDFSFYMNAYNNVENVVKVRTGEEGVAALQDTH